MNNLLKLRIVLQKPPAGILFGLQKGSGSNYETIQKQRSGMEDLYFDLEVELRGDKTKDAALLFKSPSVQGKPGEKFIYIDIGIAAGDHLSSWSRRLKVPLTGITWEDIDALILNTGCYLETRVPGTAKDGGPNCATVKPFGGWKVKCNE
jgi:hypothetical protein